MRIATKGAGFFYNQKLTAAAAFLMIAQSGVATAQENGQAPATKPEQALAQHERFGGWELSCVANVAKEQGSQACKLSQKLVAGEKAEAVFLATVLPSSKKGTFVGIMSVPYGGYLPPGMVLKFDRGQPFKVLFETCNAMGCHGGFELGGRILKELSTGKSMSVRLWTTKSTPVDIKVDLDGFAKGFAALKGRAL